jgi:hypothetical protein
VIHVHPHEAAGLTIDDYARRRAWLPEPATAAEHTTLYRPVGPQELGLIQASGWRRFPPRLPEQPIFYPVCNPAYAVQIAVEWNVPQSGSAAVVAFDVPSALLAAYERQVVGAAMHEEYWIPAEELEALNDAIVGEIRVIARLP